MAERLSRKELYDLVWSEPLRTLSSRFGISDVALKKTCARAEIPTPERGYWAKKDAEKPTFQVVLPICPPRMDNQVLIAEYCRIPRPSFLRMAVPWIGEQLIRCSMWSFLTSKRSPKVWR
jgi:hypothetical protein